MLFLTQYGVLEFDRNEITCDLYVPRGSALWSEAVCDHKNGGKEPASPHWWAAGMMTSKDCKTGQTYSF